MERISFEVGLFAWDEQGGARLLGRSDAEELVALVRARLAADRRRDLARLDEGPVRIVPSSGSEEGPG